MSIPAIVVHGGAGKWQQSDIAMAHAACQRAAQAGWQILNQGGHSLDAVAAATQILEDDPLFNAGTGSVLNARGDIAMDAAIMNGANLAAGAVAGIRHYKNPILIARRVLESGQAIMLTDAGAEEFAQLHYFERIDPASLLVTRRQEQWQKSHGTVGAVAIDQFGHLAAATSTGGLTNKLPGRISDSAIIGCGTYADQFGAVSCTGVGEAIIRTVLAKSTVTLSLHTDSAMVTAQRAIAQFSETTQAEAGLIFINRLGHIGIAHNAIAMPHYWITRE